MPLKPKPLPSAHELRKLFRYDPETGAFFSRTSATNRRVGERCDRLSGGYRVVYFAPRLLSAHRVAWKMVYGVDPDGYIDHINGDQLDNSIANLRECTHPQNMCNRSAPPHNTSGEKGVAYRRESGKWRAYITVDRKKINLGTFVSKNDAIKVVRAARLNLHGEFAKN